MLNGAAIRIRLHTDTAISAEFQIPPIVSRYASFMFSFLGRGVCTCLSTLCLRSCELSLSPEAVANTPNNAVYIFIGSVLAGDHWFNWVAGIIVALVGIGYVVLEFIPSIEPPANMRYALSRIGVLYDYSHDGNREAEASSWGAEQI